MDDNHGVEVPRILEQMVSGLGELAVVLGEAGKRAVPIVRQHLLEAMAARDRGDAAATMRSVAAAMREITALADRLDPMEGQMMRAVAARFENALRHGSIGEARRDAEEMFVRSGARERQKNE
jgi:hypothetical protein